MPPTERYRRRLAAERDAAAVYRALAARRDGEERDVLLELAQAEERHAAHWAALLDGHADVPHRLGWRARLLSWLTRRVGSLLVLALVQRAELRDVYAEDADASAAMAADERVHARIVAVLARRRRARASGTLRATVFGVNDGLVSNLALVLGVLGAGVASDTVLLTGLAGLLAGALSMAAGEYVSVRTQRDLLSTGAPPLDPAAVAPLRDTDTHELALAFRAEGLPPSEADRRAAALLDATEGHQEAREGDTSLDVVGTAAAAATSSFAAFAAGAMVPVLPFFFARGVPAVTAAVGLSAASLFATGAATGLLAGGPPLLRGFRQLAIGAMAAAATWGLGTLLGVSLS